MKKFKVYSMVAGIMFLLVFNVQAQKVYKLQTENSNLIVTGTSTVHDWEIKATDFSAETALTIDGNEVTEISQVEFTTSASSLESGKKLMDSKTHDALKAEKFPEIKFSINNPENIRFNDENATITGSLTIAGKTKEVSVKIDVDVTNEQKFEVSGQVPLKMSEFNIDPPTAMMGTIKTGNEIIVKFDLEFHRSNEAFSGNF